MFVHSGTSGGATSNNPMSLAKGYPQRTIFENLEEEGISFGIYYQNIPAVLFYRNLRKLKYVFKFHSYGLSFKDDAKKGKLPSYTVIEQRYMDTIFEPANDDHPSHDVYQGQVYFCILSYLSILLIICHKKTDFICLRKYFFSTYNYINK